MRLGFDLDEVVVSCINGISELVKKEFDVDWNYDNYTVYGFDEMCFTEDRHLNLQISHYLKTNVPTKEFMRSLKPIEGAVCLIRYLKELGHKIYFISSRPQDLAYQSSLWLLKHNIPFDGSYIIGRSVEKGLVASGLNLDLFVDDEVGHLESVLKHKEEWSVGLFLMDKPYNRWYTGKDFIRLNNLDEIKKFIGGVL